MDKQADIKKIKEITSKILKNDSFAAFKIYLFGSRARGDFSSSSDYDILIVLRKKIGIKKKIALFTKLRRALAKQRYDVDIVIKSADEVDYYKDKVGHIVRSALNDGVMI
ncbi:MAG: nucleotidyltransferase domain-containing protein [Candidatus Aminicenantes bacterium]|nr:nucleotidyltransferase domain-containing protein [Candidatus Aminicenantes bacterium]